MRHFDSCSTYMLVTSALATSALVVANTLTGCLPADTRPTPGAAVVTVFGDQAIREGFVTADGWNVSFDRVLISLGEVNLDGDDCNQYSESDYLRIIDLGRPQAQRLCLLHALGNCSVSYRLQTPSRDAVLGDGIDTDVKRFMRSPGSDAFVKNRGIALHVAGTATLAAASYRFEWSFRRSLDYTDCGTIDFTGGQSQQLELHVHPAVLFQTGLEGDATELRFNHYAAADADHDRNVTLEELDQAPPTTQGSFATLAGQLYLGLVPKAPRLDDMLSCTISSIESD